MSIPSLNTDSVLALYFASGLLAEMGWPRKLGMFKGEGYDTSLADMAVGNAIDWGAALGAGRPRLAVQMIAEILRDYDWEGDDPPNIKAIVDGASEEGSWSTAASPQEAVHLIPPVNVAWPKSTISVEEFRDRQLSGAMEWFLLKALLWGLSNPDRFEAWYSSRREDYDSMLPKAQAAGLEVGESVSLPEWFEASEEVVRDYERDIRPLPSIPPRLSADAEELGWRV
jgi:hypothetical protein